MNEPTPAGTSPTTTGHSPSPNRHPPPPAGFFTPARKRLLTIAAVVAAAAAVGYYFYAGTPAKEAGPGRRVVERASAASDKLQVELTESQARAITVQPVGEAVFEARRNAVGTIDFDQNSLVQVFTPYQGRIIAVNVNIGDRVEQGDILFTVDSPDLLQATSTLISAAGVLTLQNRNLKRMTDTVRGGGGAQKDVDQAASDQQAAEGALRAARDAMRIYGKADQEIERIVNDRRAESTLIIRSPISGYVTARNAAPGLFIQPGNAPAPLTLAAASTMWMIANVPEADSAAIHPGQRVTARVPALPGRTFTGTVNVVGSTVDLQTRRVMVRSVIADPDRLLRAGMFADFIINVGDTARSPAVPDNTVVREGDGSMTVWTTADRRSFERKTISTGLRQNGQVQITNGLRPGDLVVTDGGIFLTNKLVGGPTD